MHLPIFFRVTSPAPGQSYDCPSASEVTMKDMGKIDFYPATTNWFINHEYSLITPVLCSVNWMISTVLCLLIVRVISSCFYMPRNANTVLSLWAMTHVL